MLVHFLLWKWRTLCRALITQSAPQINSAKPDALHDVGIFQRELAFSRAGDLCEGGPLEHAAVIE